MPQLPGRPSHHHNRQHPHDKLSGHALTMGGNPGHSSCCYLGTCALLWTVQGIFLALYYIGRLKEKMTLMSLDVSNVSSCKYYIWVDSEFHELQILFYYFFRQIIPSGLKVDYKKLRLVPSFNGFHSRIY